MLSFIWLTAWQHKFICFSTQWDFLSPQLVFIWEASEKKQRRRDSKRIWSQSTVHSNLSLLGWSNHFEDNVLTSISCSHIWSYQKMLWWPMAKAYTIEIKWILCMCGHDGDRNILIFNCELNMKNVQHSCLKDHPKYLRSKGKTTRKQCK